MTSIILSVLKSHSDLMGYQNYGTACAGIMPQH